MAINTLTDFYEVNPESANPIQFRLEIGYGEPAFSRIYIDSMPYGEEQEDNININLGYGKNLKGKKMLIVTTLWNLDSRDQNAITIRINGGKGDYHHTIMGSPIADGGLGTFVTTIYF